MKCVFLLSTYSDSKEDQKPSYLLRQHILTEEWSAICNNAGTLASLWRKYR